METNKLLNRASKFEHLSAEEGLYLFENAATTDLIFIANELRKKQVPSNKVTWIIDRNANTTNVCNANCKFCNFYRIFVRMIYTKSQLNFYLINITFYNNFFIINITFIENF